MSDEEFTDQFRLRKNSIHDFIEEIQDDLVAAMDSREMMEAASMLRH